MQQGSGPNPLGPREERFFFAAVFLISASVLLLQIALTRVFSFTLWYHFAYVTISVALLGYGASGTLLAVFPGLAGRDPARRLSLYATLCGLSVVVAYLTFAKLPFHPFQLREHPGTQVPLMLVYYAAITTPFFFAGLCMSVALATFSRHVSRVYFFDLTGAGVGCLLVIFVMTMLSPPGAVVAAAVALSAAGMLFAAARGGRRLAVAATGTIVVAALGGAAFTSLRIMPSPEKFLYAFLSKDDAVDHSFRWNAVFRSDTFRFGGDEEFSRTASYARWGISPKWKPFAAKRAPKVRFITHDGDAGAVIYNFDGDLDKLEMFDHLILKTPYLLLDRPEVLVIGVGGGTDIVNAIKQRAKHVTGVELDPNTVDLVRNRQADFAGHLYERPDVTMIVGEGRSTVRHSGKKYDLIQMTGVDTLAALSTGAYVLAENYLYTTDAIGEFLDHLTPKGVLCVVVADYSQAVGFPRHTMRQVSLFSEALQRRGINDPERHVIVLASAEPIPNVAMVLREAPFTPEEVERVRGFASEMGFHPWALPGEAIASPHSRQLRATPEERERLLASYPLILTPTDDDNPFFFNFYRWRHLLGSLDEVDVGHTLATGQIILALIVAFSVLLSAVLILGPLLVFQRKGLPTQGRWGLIAFFAGIGLGFIFIEISFVQKFVLFLGYPTYSLTVVLASLLTSSGVGSYLTGRTTLAPERRLLPLLGALVAISGIYLLLLPVIFQAFLGSAFAVRVAIAAAALVPLGLAMGMFFPTGIQIVRRSHESFVPWAWGINGCASVVGTVLAVVLAMGYGFRAVTLLAMGIYALAVLGLRASARRLAI
jgi:Spermine/spermidine synthase domain